MAQTLARYQAVPAPSKNAGSNIEAEDDEPSASAASSKLSTTSPKSRPRKTIIFKFLLILLGGYLVLAGAVAYLTFLWFGRKTGYAWSRIVLHNWVTTSVVIISLVIRTVVTTQMTLVSSILALAVLKSGAPVAQIPRLSSLRYSNSGPSELLYLLFPSLRHTRIVGIFSLVAALAILTLLSQFTSTLLASDLAPDLIETLANQSHSPVFWNLTRGRLEYNTWTDPLESNPVTFPKFAEFSNRSDVTQGLHGDQYDDTGPSIRAILPVSTEQGRSDLRSFKGNASIYDARWICTRPSFNLSTLRLQGNYNTQTFSGSLTLDNPRPPMVNGMNIPFERVLQASSFDERTRWPLKTCYLLNSGLVSALMTKYDTKEEYSVTENNTFYYLSPARNETNRTPADDVLGEAFLVINQTDYELRSIHFLYSNGSHWELEDGLLPGLDFKSVQEGVNYNDSWVTDNHGPWTRVTSTQAAANVTMKYTNGASNGASQGLVWPFHLDVSFCGSGHKQLKPLDVEAHGQTSQAEPANTTLGMKQIGATTIVYELDERGILTLDGSFRGLLEQNTNLPGFYFGLFEAGYQTRAWHYYPLFTDPDDKVLGVHESRAELLQRTLRETGSLALAMQGAAHTSITGSYYMNLPSFENDSISTVTFATPAIQPTRVRGYLVVVVTLGLYTLTTLITIFLLFGLDNWSYIADSIDQSWQAYAQVWTLRDATDEEIFHHCKATKEMTVQTDAAVKKDFKKQQRLDKQVFALEEDEDGHRVFRRREYKSPKD